MTDVPERPRLTRDDLEAVLRRAAELEATTGSEIPDLSEEDVLRLAAEVGLSEESVRRALAEHFAASAGGRLLTESRGPARICGPGLVVAIRTVEGSADELRGRLESHFREKESLRLVRRVSTGSLWEPDRGVVVSIVRSVDLQGRGYRLAKARSLEIRVVELGADHSQVTLVANLGKQRAEWFWGLGIGVGGGGAAMLGAAAFAADLLALGLASAVWWGGALWLARGGYGRTVERIRITLEGLLDRLEHGEPLEPPRPSWRELLK